MFEWFLLLVVVPAAAYSGWSIGRRRKRKAEERQANRYSNRYFRGLNYLLNEQPDKAIEVFLKLAEVNQDTVETHFALGSLFRRRGEVDRAIRFHQNIIAKPSLNDRQRTRALLELGEDYMRAGLLDRAERLFAELIERDAHTPSALRHLLDIYQQEKDWELAIEIARRIEQTSGKNMGSINAHFCCELAQQELEKDNQEQARRHLRQARRYHQANVRARLLEANMAEQQGLHQDAIDGLRKVIELQPQFLPEVLPGLIRNFEQAGKADEIRPLLEQYVSGNPGISTVIALADVIQSADGAPAGAKFLLDQLRQRPSVRGLQYLLEVADKQTGPDLEEYSGIFEELAGKILKKEALYRCENCGFGGHQHHWQCPSCKQWDSTGRIRGVTGE